MSELGLPKTFKMKVWEQAGGMTEKEETPKETYHFTLPEKITVQASDYEEALRLLHLEIDANLHVMKEA